MILYNTIPLLSAVKNSSIYWLSSLSTIAKQELRIASKTVSFFDFYKISNITGSIMNVY